MNSSFTKVLLALLIVIGISKNFAKDFNKEVFERRRLDLMNRMEDGIAVFKGAELMNRNSDIDYKFRQKSDFYYLTGIENPGMVFILSPQSDKEFVLFFNEVGFMQQLFTGKQPGLKEWMEIYGADTAYVMDEFDKVFAKSVKGKDRIYYCLGEDDFDEKVTSAINPDRSYKPSKLVDPRPIIHEMRLIKDDIEIEMLQKAINISCEALHESIKAIEPGMNESEVDGIINYIFKKNGSHRHGFPPIVSSGENLVIAHYQDNKSEMKDGDLAMMDIGAEYGYYSADVTRTVPINGKFTEEQKELYEIALKAIDEEIKMMAPGVGMSELNSRAFEVLADGLLKVGLITDKTQSWQVRLWFPAYSLHYLGLDTHDVGEVKYRDPKGKILEPEMVFAVEPGIYVSKEMFEMLPSFAKMYMPNLTEEDINKFMETVRPAVEKYKGICVRLEDDVLVTEDGHKNLSGHLLPRAAEEIEALMEEKSIFN
ncbi:MAG: aminopeptidase P N-terminal domain-containing protein [Ignavibacteria bacterium]|jgi:Xaa-Pro aminopeptidase